MISDKEIIEVFDDTFGPLIKRIERLEKAESVPTSIKKAEETLLNTVNEVVKDEISKLEKRVEVIEKSRGHGYSRQLDGTGICKSDNIFQNLNI